MYCLPNCRCRFVSLTIRHAVRRPCCPYLAWTRSVDRWDPDWSDEAKRNAVATSFVLHQRKGTLTALRQVVEPIGALSEVTEWWQRSPTGVPGTFEITVDVSDRGIDEGTVLELERLLDDVRPVSRHLTRLDLRITPVIRSRHGLAVTDGDTLEIFPGNSDMTTNTPKYGGLLTDIVPLRWLRPAPQARNGSRLIC